MRRKVQMRPPPAKALVPGIALVALALALIQIQAGELDGARQTLQDGQTRIPDSGRITWGMGVLSVVEGKNGQAETDFQRALDLMPQWESSYSALGTFYFDTGQVSKATQTLDRYARIFPHGQLNVDALRRVLAGAAHEQSAALLPLSSPARSQFLAMAMTLADANP